MGFVVWFGLVSFSEYECECGYIGEGDMVRAYEERACNSIQLLHQVSCTISLSLSLPAI